MRISAPTSSEQYRALRDGAAILDRTSRRGRLLLAGSDRRSYLQGLLTNDIAALSAGAGCYAAYLTPQGRMIADMRVFELGDAILLDLEGFVTGTVRDRLSQFIFSEDVEVRDLTEQTAQIGVYGPQAAAALSSALAAAHEPDEIAPPAAGLDAMPMLASSRWDVHGSPVHVLRSDDAGVAGFDIVLPAASAPGLSAALRGAGATDVDEEVAEITRIEAGRPRFGVDMTGDTIPLEAGIEDRAISRTKGCYVGQEIIIRVLDRGHGRVARRLAGLRLDTPGVPARGEPIQAAGRGIGEVTSAALSPALGKVIALGYLHRDHAAPGTIVTIAGERATVVETPFV